MIFLTEDERRSTHSTCYFEFQFCESDIPLKNGCVRDNIIKSWKEDSLCISDDDFDGFYKLYGSLFDCAVFPNGERGFDYCGINYYGKDETENILAKLSAKNIDRKKYAGLIPWLKIAAERGKGFYILGL
ncbi:MAG: hypothetical protein K2H90_00190 [Oscillospiraceae bacterium]|nr:hypothetical protein [Oscillospiraceae bacterium]